MKNDLKCTHCGSIIPEMKDSNPTFFGKGFGDKLVDVICLSCWERA